MKARTGWREVEGIKKDQMLSVYSSEGKGAKEYHNITPRQQTLHKMFGEGKTQEGGYLCSGEKQQETEGKTRLI